MVKNINCNLLIRWNFISPYEFLNFFFFYSQIKSWNLYNVSYFHLQKLYTCSAYIYPVVIFFSCFFLLLIFCISFLRMCDVSFIAVISSSLYIFLVSCRGSLSRSVDIFPCPNFTGILRTKMCRVHTHLEKNIV